MKVLIVCKYNSLFNSGITPFLETMVTEIKRLGHSVTVYQIKKKGIVGYLYHFIDLNWFLLKSRTYDIIHGIYGMSGILASLQPFRKSIVTFIGSDINIPIQRKLTKLLLISNKKILIFVSEKLYALAGYPNKSVVIPFGVNVSLFYPLDKEYCKSLLKMDLQKQYILFGAKFSNAVKNSKLFFDAIGLIDDSNLEVIELNGIAEEQINFLYNAVDMMVLTSLKEGSPTVIKEAMACNCPIVATDVGDINQILKGIEGCYLTSFEPVELAAKIKLALKFSQKERKTKGRDRLLEIGFDSETCTKKVINTYLRVLGKF